MILSTPLIQAQELLPAGQIPLPLPVAQPVAFLQLHEAGFHAGYGHHFRANQENFTLTSVKTTGFIIDILNSLLMQDNY